MQNFLSKNEYCRLIVTNADLSFLGGTAQLPGEGLLSAVLHSASQHQPIVCASSSSVTCSWLTLVYA